MDRQRAREVLGVGPEAVPEEVKAAFRRGVMIRHPDRGGDPESLRELVEAFRTFSGGDPAAAGRVVAYRRRRGMAEVAEQWRRRRARIAAVAGLNETVGAKGEDGETLDRWNLRWIVARGSVSFQRLRGYVGRGLLRVARVRGGEGKSG